MRQASTLIKHNLKKAKGQYVSFGIVICLTALILNIALVLKFQTFAAYEKQVSDLDTADVNFLVPLITDYDALMGEVEKIRGVTAVERHEGVLEDVTVREFAGSDFVMKTLFYDLDAERKINRFAVLEEEETKGNSVYLPLYMKELGGFLPGETIVYAVKGEDFTCKVGGIVSEMQYGNYGTGMIGAYLPASAYKEFAGEHEEDKVAEYSLDTAEDADLEEVKASVTGMLKEKGIDVLNICDRETAKSTRTMVCTLLIAIFLALAAIILAVSIFLSDFRIRSTIEDELAQMGVLKAVGYTGGLIILSAIAPYTLVGTVAALAGIAVSYLLLPTVAHILAVQSGFSYTPVFDLKAFLIVLLLLVCVILLFSLLSAGKIRKLEPINAIRGIRGKAGVGQNVLLAAVSFGIMVLLSFAGTLFYNVTIKPDNFTNTISEESPSVIFAGMSENLKELENVLVKDDRVAQTLEYGTMRVSSPEGSLKAFVCEDFGKVRNDICYEGRNPAKENEIAVGAALAEKYPIGSGIELTYYEETAVYTVTGYVQSVNNAGEVCELTSEGYGRLGGMTGTVYVYLKEEGAASFIREYEEHYSEWIEASVNYEKLAKSAGKLYIGIVSVVAGVLFFISVLLVLLVLYVIIGSVISRRKTEFGIYKAVGYTSRQLTVKTALEFLPVVAISAGVSAALSLWYLPAMNNAIFEMVGAMKNQFEISIQMLFVIVVIFTFVSFLISVRLAAPVKKITVYALLKD